MIAGLPGTGIGGLFYLLSTLLMPFREFYLTCRGKSSIKQWKVVGLQMSLALGVVGSFWMTGTVLGNILPVSARLNLHKSHWLNIFYIKAFVVSIGVLFGVLFAVEIVGLLFFRLMPKKSLVV
ncbi:MAG: hypothetical protein ACHQVK_03845 [Candidatus Paceibacterales bacterium]